MNRLFGWLFAPRELIARSLPAHHLRRGDWVRLDASNAPESDGVRYYRIRQLSWPDVGAKAMAVDFRGIPGVLYFGVNEPVRVLRELP